MSTAEARAAGIRQANAPVVAFVEDHSYPDPDWAERLIEAHRKLWAAVGPVMMVNANPATMISWPIFLSNTLNGSNLSQKELSATYRGITVLANVRFF